MMQQHCRRSSRLLERKQTKKDDDRLEAGAGAGGISSDNGSSAKRLKCSSSGGARVEERNYIVHWDFNGAAAATALRTMLVDNRNTMRSDRRGCGRGRCSRSIILRHHQQQQHISGAPSQPIGGRCSSLSSAALVAAKVSARHRPRNQYQPYSPRRYLLQQMMNLNQFRQVATASSSQSASQVSFPSGLASSSLARELIQRIGGPTTPTIQRTSNTRPTPADDAMQMIKSKSQIHNWHWDEPDDWHEQQQLLSDDKLEVCFHPECAESTAAIRGSQPFKQNGSYYYWEVTIYDKIFGTSMMLGLCTEDQRLHLTGYCNLIGQDKTGWSLSHKGLIWHDGKYSKYTNDFTTNQTLTVGLLFDTRRGELSYFIDGQNLGVAFLGLNNCKKDLYPVVGSTAKMTRMRLTASYCGYVSLFERACHSVVKSIRNEAELVQTLQDNKIPKSHIEHITKLAEVCRNQKKKIAKSAQIVNQQGQNCFNSV